MIDAPQLIDYLESRIDRILSRPEMWGSNAVVEGLILELLITRRVVLEAPGELLHAYDAFLRDEFAGSSPLMLASQLEQAQRDRELAPILRRFVERERFAARPPLARERIAMRSGG